MKKAATMNGFVGSLDNVPELVAVYANLSLDKANFLRSVLRVKKLHDDLHWELMGKRRTGRDYMKFVVKSKAADFQAFYVPFAQSFCELGQV